MDGTYLAVELGHSRYMVGLISPGGEVLSRQNYLWKEAGRQAVAGELCAAVEGLLGRFSQLNVPAIGLSVPGLVGHRTGLWMECAPLGIRDFALVPLMQERFLLPAYLDNDAISAALAEKAFGACRQTDDFIYLSLNTGVDGAVFTGGKPWYGADGCAGELGHCVVVENGRPCSCGLHGCLEMHASGPALAKNYIEQGGSPLLNGKPANARQVAALADQGDKAALRAFALEGVYLGRTLAAACNLLSPQKVVLGGAVSLAFRHFEASLKDTLTSRLSAGGNGPPAVEPSALGVDGGLLGAAAVAMRGVAQLKHKTA